MLELGELNTVLCTCLIFFQFLKLIISNFLQTWISIYFSNIISMNSAILRWLMIDLSSHIHVMIFYLLCISNPCWVFLYSHILVFNFLSLQIIPSCNRIHVNWFLFDFPLTLSSTCNWLLSSFRLEKSLETYMTTWLRAFLQGLPSFAFALFGVLNYCIVCYFAICFIYLFFKRST